MADFPDIVLTNQGLNMIALAQAGQQLIFTKIVLGNGTLDNEENVQELTELVSTKLDLNIVSITSKHNGQVDLEARVNNAGLEKGFFCRECGVFAKIGEEGIEKLYSYTNAGALADYLPPNTNAYNDIFIVSTVVGNSTNMQMIIDDSVIYATNEDLQEHDGDENAHGNILAKAVPAGTVIHFASEISPQGYLKCNGAELLRNEYNRLFEAIGTVFGEGDGGTTFNLPDLRGEFIRSWDDGRGIDENRSFGSWQEDMFRSHTHKYLKHMANGGQAGPTLNQSPGWVDTQATGGEETRPRNIALLACIKY